MTLPAEQPKAEKDLVWLFELELGYRIEGKTWTQAGSPNTACWYMAHLTERKPSRVRQLLRSTHVVTVYDEKTSLAACQAATSSWYYDASNGRLYVHASAGDAPDTASKYYLSSHFLKRFVTDQFEAPKTIVDPDGKQIESRLRVNIPEYTQEVNEFPDVGIRETWSSVFISNPDGKYDAALATYIWHMCRYYLKCGSPGDAYAAFTTIVRGRTGSIGWTEEEIEVRTEDQLKSED